MTTAGSRPRSQSPHIWGQFRLGPQMTTQPIEPKNRCWATGPCIVPKEEGKIMVPDFGRVTYLTFSPR
jgi:hypothetical protein